MNVRNFLIVALIVCLSGPIFAGNHSGYQVDPGDQAMVSLLWMVVSDLNMCGRSLNHSVMDTVSAIGHLNNAQSALKRSNLDPAYIPLANEILTRIGKIKFYLVMNDFKAVHMRLSQLISVVRGVLSGSTGQYQNGSYNNNSGYQSNGSGYLPPVRPEIPVGGFGGGQNIPVTGMPAGGLVPVN